MKKIFNLVYLPNWLCIVLTLTFVLRIPSFFEPFSYGDEMIYLTLGEGIRQHLVLYQDLHDNKPPLLYFLAAIAGSLFWFRVILAGWMLGTIILFWKLLQTLFPKNLKIQQAGTATFALLTTLPLLEGQIANAELFMLGPIIFGFWLILAKKNNFKNLLLAGFSFGIATLFKVPAVFDIPAIVLFWLTTTPLTRPNIFKISRKTIIIFLGLSLPIGLTFIWYGARGAWNEYFTAAFRQNVGYLSSFRPADVEKSFLVRNGPLLARGALTLAGMGLVLNFRKKLSPPFIFAGFWLILNLFAITLSERPYPHYLVQYTPAVSIFIALLLAAKNIEQTLSMIPLFFALLAPVYYQFWYYPTFSYYQRFAEFAVGKISREEYFSRFDGEVNRNYKIADFLAQTTQSQDRVFVWGSNAAIYALARRLPPLKYTTDYHIHDFSSKAEVVLKLTAQKPEVVIILPQAESFKELDNFVRQNYLLINTIESAEIWKLMGN